MGRKQFGPLRKDSRTPWKNCTVLRPWAGRPSTLRCHSRWRGSIDSAPNGCSLRGESPETRRLDCPRLPIEGKSAARRSGYGPKA